MKIDRMHDDIEYLARRMPHRGGNTENERIAAEYIYDRFKESASDTTIDDFYSIDSWSNLFSLYYFDFVFVTLIALWLPWAALVYGLTVFGLYMAEFTGYQTMGRFLPQYETQNVSARFICRHPKRLLVLTAHYDSPKISPFTESRAARRLRWVHLAVVSAMTLILVTCAVQGVAEMNATDASVWISLRWILASLLIGAGITLYLSETRSDFSRGANDNASGVAVLLHLAKRFEVDPLDSTEVLLVATGSKGAWLGGIQSLFQGEDFERVDTYFLNIEAVGAGELGFTKREGLMYPFPCSKTLSRLAREEAAQFGATEFVYRGWPTDALVPLARGYHAMSVMGRDESDLPVHWGTDRDRVEEIDYSALNNAKDFVEKIVRRLDAS